LSIHGWSLHDSRLDSTFSGDMQEFSIFNSLGSKPYIKIMSTYCGSLRHSESLDFFQDDLSHISIFSRLSTKAHMEILIADPYSLRKIESNEYKVMDMKTHFYF
jgi:hypothetical protein